MCWWSDVEACKVERMRDDVCDLALSAIPFRTSPPGPPNLSRGPAPLSVCGLPFLPHHASSRISRATAAG